MYTQMPRSFEQTKPEERPSASPVKT
jgi:COMPASS component SWD3